MVPKKEFGSVSFEDELAGTPPSFPNEYRSAKPRTFEGVFLANVTTITLAFRVSLEYNLSKGYKYFYCLVHT